VPLQKAEEEPADNKSAADPPQPAGDASAVEVETQRVAKTEEGAPGSRWSAKVILMGGVDRE